VQHVAEAVADKQVEQPRAPPGTTERPVASSPTATVKVCAKVPSPSLV
jgi:hypothetical protein